MSNKPVRKRQREAVAEATLPNAWVDRELAGCDFRDERLGKRFRSLLERLAASPGETIPLVCQDWANTKAAYRFLDNDRVSEAEILAGHFHATRDRAAATAERVNDFETPGCIYLVSKDRVGCWRRSPVGVG